MICSDVMAGDGKTNFDGSIKIARIRISNFNENGENSQNIQDLKSEEGDER